jgi:hypothetical protein
MWGASKATPTHFILCHQKESAAGLCERDDWHERTDAPKHGTWHVAFGRETLTCRRTHLEKLANVTLAVLDAARRVHKIHRILANGSIASKVCI